MAFCEMCGTAIPDGQTKCEACAGTQNQSNNQSNNNQNYSQQSANYTQQAAAPKVAPTAAPTAAPKASAPVFGNISFDPNGFKTFDINLIGLFAQLFNILVLCLPVLTKTHIWEFGDYVGGEWYLIPIAMIGVILVSVAGYLLKLDKYAKIAGIVNLVMLHLIRR